MSKFIKFTEELLSKQHLGTIREIGRQIGVKAPAGSNKEDVIKEILLIQAGKKEPEPPTKRGAPPKIKVDVSAFLVKDEPVLQPGADKDGWPTDLPFDKVDEENRHIEFSDVVRDDEIIKEGILEIVGSYGFLRVRNYENSEDDIYVSIQNIKKYNLKKGDKVKARAIRIKENESPALQEALAINDMDPDSFKERENFDDLVPYYPDKRLVLETEDNDVSLRCIDLLCPIGKGQRGLIVAPPKTGKTTLLKKIASAIEQNNKRVKLIVLLIDERPEEVTDIRRSIRGEVVYSTFDEGPAHHVRAAELVISRAKRLVELGYDVVILMDSITRLARAYNSVEAPSGKTLSGGLDPNALQGPKKFFGAARNIEGNGSLTILSTALINTESRMDDVIFEEFKGTGNMEIHLSSKLSEKRVFPAIDLLKSGTRKDELLLSKEELDASYKLRRILGERVDATEVLIDMMKKTKNNADLISKLDAWIKLYQK